MAAPIGHNGGVVATLSLIAFIGLFLLVAWLTRNARSKPKCCQPGQWPPDDISARARQR